MLQVLVPLLRKFAIVDTWKFREESDGDVLVFLLYFFDLFFAKDQVEWLNQVRLRGLKGCCLWKWSIARRQRYLAWLLESVDGSLIGQSEGLGRFDCGHAGVLPCLDLNQLAQQNLIAFLDLGLLFAFLEALSSSELLPALPQHWVFKFQISKLGHWPRVRVSTLRDPLKLLEVQPHFTMCSD